MQLKDGMAEGVFSLDPLMSCDGTLFKRAESPKAAKIDMAESVEENEPSRRPSHRVRGAKFSGDPGPLRMGRTCRSFRNRRAR